jgi:hypothetical protein
MATFERGLVLDRLDFLHAAERPRVRERLILADRWVRLPSPHNPGFLPQQSVRPRAYDVKNDRGSNASAHTAVLSNGSTSRTSPAALRVK